jgi:hypothetical protein
MFYIAHYESGVRRKTPDAIVNIRIVNLVQFLVLTKHI